MGVYLQAGCGPSKGERTTSINAHAAQQRSRPRRRPTPSPSPLTSNSCSSCSLLPLESIPAAAAAAATTADAHAPIPSHGALPFCFCAAFATGAALRACEIRDPNRRQSSTKRAQLAREEQPAFGGAGRAARTETDAGRQQSAATAWLEDLTHRFKWVGPTSPPSLTERSAGSAQGSVPGRRIAPRVPGLSSLPGPGARWCPSS